MSEQIEYKEISDTSFSERVAATFEIERSREGVWVLSGPCPRCHHLMLFSFSTEIPAGFGRRAKSSGETNVVMFCTADAYFPGHPPDVAGCGAYWNLRISGLS